MPPRRPASGLSSRPPATSSSASRPDRSNSSPGRFLPAFLAPVIWIAGCSGTGNTPATPAAPAAPAGGTATAKPPARAGQPGSADYSGKGLGTGAEGR